MIVPARVSSTAPALERSVDDGVTWEDATPTTYGIGQIIAVSTFASGQAEIVAMVGEDCHVQALRTFTDGEFWESYDEVLAEYWYVDPTRASEIVTPSGALSAPCVQPRALQSFNGIRALVCDGTAYVLADDASWDALPPKDAVALTISDTTVLVAHSTAECPGLTVTASAVVDHEMTQRAECIGTASSADPVAIALDETSLVAWVGESWILTSY